MNVKIVRLKSGEELVADIIKETETGLTLSKACIVLPTGDAGQIGLYRFMPYGKVENGLDIQKGDTYFIVEPQDDLTAYYKSIVKPNDIITGPEADLIV